jgi:hypothetical protein
MTHTAISLAEKSLRTGKLQFSYCSSFVTVFADPKLAGLLYLGILQAKGNATAHPKMGSLKQSI